MPGRNSLSVLRVDASMRGKGSYSRQLVDEVVSVLIGSQGPAALKSRDLADGIPFVNDAWIEANFTDPEKRTLEHRSVLSQSDAYVEEVKEADVLVIGLPVYNFGVPAVFKAWIDMVVRPRVTFRYSPDGAVGLLEGKKAYVVITSGGTEVGSTMDFVSGYVRHVLNFVGITDVEIIAADELMHQTEEKLSIARATIRELF